MSELKITWNQTRTQAAVERQYRMLDRISKHLESVTPHEAMLGELRDFQELQRSFTLGEIVAALDALSKIAHSGPRSLKMAYLRKHMAAVLKIANDGQGGEHGRGDP